MNPQERITNTLLLNASFIDNIGLLHGKIGIAIAFYHLARKTGNKVYEDYAGELIDEIYEEISANTPCDFEDGLAGIGWGIEYLVQNGFIEADTDEVLEDFDEKITHEFIFHNNSGIDLAKGLTGYAAYFAMRLNNRANEKKSSRKITDTLNKVLDELQNHIPALTSPYGIKQTDESTETKESKLTIVISLTNFLNLPILLIALADIYTPSSSKLQNGLLNALAINQKLPEDLFCKLMLYSAFTKLLKSSSERLNSENKSYLAKTTEDLEESIIADATEAKSFELLNGASGISVLCHYIYFQTQNIFFKAKADEWAQKILSIQNREESVFAGFKPTDEKTGFGLVNGIAGLILASSLIPANLTSKIESSD